MSRWKLVMPLWLLMVAVPPAGSSADGAGGSLPVVGRAAIQVCRLHGGCGAESLPLWSLPTQQADGHGGNADCAPASCSKGAHDVRKAAEGPAVPSTAVRQKRHDLLDAARRFWWKGEIEAADQAFLNSLGWCRSEAHPCVSHGAAQRAAPLREGDEAQYVTLDGGMRWLDSKPLTRHGEMFEEADAMCEYAAFLFEATGENSAAEQILRTVQQKDRLHGCAIEVLGDLLESQGRTLDAQLLYSRLPGLHIDEHAFDGGDTAPAAGGVVDEWVVNVAPSEGQAMPLARLARLYEKRGRSHAAMQLLDLALDCQTSCVPAMLLKAELHVLCGESLKAKDMLLAALDAQPSVPQEMEALLALALLHAEQQQVRLQTPDISAQASTATGKEGSKSRHAEGEWSLEDAETLYQRACELRLDLTAEARGAHLYALIRMRNSGAVHGVHWQPLVEYAVFLHRYLDRTDGVARLCDAALQAAPHSVDATLRVAWIHHSVLADFKSAAVLIKKALRHDPSNPRVHRVYGNLLLRVGRVAEAEKMLLRGIWLDSSQAHPPDATALLDLGRLVARQGRLREARERFQQAYDAASCREDAAAADVAMAALYIMRARTEDAQAFFERAQQRDPQIANEATLLGLVEDFRKGACSASGVAKDTPDSGEIPRGRPATESQEGDGGELSDSAPGTNPPALHATLSDDVVREASWGEKEASLTVSDREGEPIVNRVLGSAWQQDSSDTQPKKSAANAVTVGTA